MPRSRLYGTGLNQDELCSLIVLMRTNMLLLTAALDADDGVGSTTYTSTFTFSLPDEFSRGYFRDQGTLLGVLQDMTTKWNAMLAVADLDATLTDTDYASLCGITDYINDESVADLLDAGMYEGSLVKWLDTMLTKFNAALAKFDADLGDTDYVAAYGITAAGYVDTAGSVLNV